MKKSIILGICCMMAANTTFAQTEDPKGLYRLHKLSYEDGRPDHIPEFAQYKYCTDVAPFTIMIATNTPKSFEYAIRTDEPHPYTYTGNTPVGENGRGTQIFDSDKDGFSLKWYNTVRPQEPIFPLNMFITEYYDRKKIDERLVRSIEMFGMKHKPAKHRFAGCWKMIGNIGTLNGKEIIVSAPIQLYKIYSEDAVNIYSGSFVSYWPLEVKNDNLIVESKNNCKIEWRDKDTFILSFDRGDGKIANELWIRSGLPRSVQKIFGTNEPINDVDVVGSFGDYVEIEESHHHH